MNNIKKFKFRPLKKSDLPCLFAWLSLPHVAQWWREVRDYKSVADKYGRWINRSI